MSKPMEPMERLEQALQALLRHADTALAVLNQIANTCPNVIWENSIPGSTRVFRYVGGTFAVFELSETGGVKKYEFNPIIVSPGGLLAAMLRKEKERLTKLAKLADVVPAEMS